MAKWGEGDPRWIVEKRADGTNVNNWHWTEKNAGPWSKEMLKELLEGFKIEDETYKCTIKELTKIDGEASASNRKAKLIFFYEWDIKAEWSGHIEGNTEMHKGKIEIPNLSEEYNADEVDISVTADTDKDEAYKIKEFLRLKGVKNIREQLSKYITNLKTEFSQGMILPAKNDQAINALGSEKPKSTDNATKRELAKPIIPKSDGQVGVKIKCKNISDKQFFKCRASDLYRALTEKDMVCAFTRNDATIQADKGSRFALFGGIITGEFTNLEAYKIIQMKWRSKSWPEEHYSIVTLNIDEAEDGTNLTLSQTGVPESDFERTRQGWSNYYWDSIRQTFGFGSRLY